MSGVLLMSEPSALNQIPDLVGVEAGEEGSPGRLLRTARKAAGVHIAALAGALKIPVSKLEALESDNFAALPDAVFARALASSICRALDLDPVPILKLMPKNEAPNFSVASSDINTAFKDTSRKMGRNSLLEHATRPISVAVVVLLLGVLALLFVPFGSESPAIGYQSAKIDLGLSEPESANKVAEMPPVLVIPETTTVVEPTTEEVTASKSTVLMPAELAVTSPEAVVPPAPVSLLEFRGLGASWVQVRDATKVVVFERTLAKGETASATGVLPLTVVVGRADATEVLVRGKVFPLASVAKENVARFEVTQ